MDFERIFAGGMIAAALAAGAWAMLPDTALAVAAPVTLPLSTTPLPLDRDDPGKTRLGELRFLGALQLRSTNPAFGGVSGLRAGADGRFLAVTDTGNWLAFTTIERDGRLIGIKDAILLPILQEGGRAVTSKADADAEALEWNPATGAATVVYEHDHRLAHFSGIDAANLASLTKAPDSIERLTAMAGWPSNGGGEGLVVMPGGARLVLSETARGPKQSHTALLTQHGKTRQIELAGVPDHAPTDAVALDATRILVLNRRFTALQGQGAALTLIDLAPALALTRVGPETTPEVLPARVLAQWQPPETLDNMEGLAIRRTEGGRTFVYILSDDNLNPMQRTILMKFELLL